MKLLAPFLLCLAVLPVYAAPTLPAITSPTACRVTWKQVLTTAPATYSKADIDKRVAAIMREALKRGGTADQVQDEGDAERREIEREIKGQSFTTLFHFVRIGKVVRCDIESEKPLYHGLEYFDGTFGIHCWLSNHPTGRSIGADLDRDTDESALRQVAGPQIARFLLSLPLEMGFSKACPVINLAQGTVTTGPNGAIVFEPVLEETRSTGTLPTANSGIRTMVRHTPSEWTFDAVHGQPVSFKTFKVIGRFDNGKLTFSKGAIDSQTTLSGYKQYPGAVWFPSHVVVKHGRMTREFTLVDAAFNEQIDPAEVKLPEMSISDGRFGEPRAMYQLKDGRIPDDEAVKKMRGKM
jgi:hypothetical protein